MKTRFASKLPSPGSTGGSYAIEIHRTPAVPKPRVRTPAKISGKKTSLGMLLDRACERIFEGRV